MASQSWWMKRIEEKAYGRLRKLRDMELWDGSAPVPIDHVLEHGLGLSISWEEVEELPGAQVFAALRPETREVVLNEKHLPKFQANPGFLRFCKAHEAGHADVFAMLAVSEQLAALAQSYYHPQRCNSSGGVVSVLMSRLNELPADLRTEVMREFREEERRRRARGEDTPLERRSVDHYAATLLMPEDLVRKEMEGRDQTRWSELYEVRDRLEVSITALVVRLKELGLIYGIQGRRILFRDPLEREQPSLF